MNNFCVKSKFNPIKMGGCVLWVNSKDFSDSQKWKDRTKKHDGANTGVTSTNGFATFDGSSSFLNFGRLTEMEGAAVIFSMSVWFKYTNPVFASDVLFTYDDDDVLEGDGSDAYFYFGADNNVRYNASTVDTVLFPSSFILDGNWHHLVLNRRTGSLVDVYLDNNLMIEGVTATSPTGGASYKLRFGFGENIAYFPGQIGDVTVFNRALRREEVRVIYLSTKNDYPVSAPPVPEIQLWLKADTGVTLNSTTVSNWADQSGKGRDVTQATALQQPTFVSNTINGNPAIQFVAASNTFLGGNTGNFGTFTGLTLFIVIKPTTTPVPYVWIFNSTADGAAGWNIAFDNPNPSWWYAGGGVVIDFNSSIVANSLYLLEIVYDSKASPKTRFYLNGVSNGSDNNAIVASSDSNFAIGYWQSGGGYFLDGYIPEIMVYDGPLAENERLRIENYLNSKYAIY